MHPQDLHADVHSMAQMCTHVLVEQHSQVCEIILSCFLRSTCFGLNKVFIECLFKCADVSFYNCFQDRSDCIIGTRNSTKNPDILVLNLSLALLFAALTTPLAVSKSCVLWTSDNPSGNKLRKITLRLSSLYNISCCLS